MISSAVINHCEAKLSGIISCDDAEELRICVYNVVEQYKNSSVRS